MAADKRMTRRFCAQDAVQESATFLQGICVAVSRRSPDKSTDNEDSCLFMQLGERSGVLAIADGAGGHVAGKEASKIALDELQRELTAAGQIEELRAPILNAFEAANALLLAEGRGAATTLVVVEIQGNSIRHYHVGDSSAIVVGQRGAVRLQTVQQSLVGYGIEAGFLHTDAALDHAERHIVLSMVGTADMRVEIGAPLVLKRFDTLLVCSDGLTDNVGVADIVERVRKGKLDFSLAGLQQLAEKNMQLPNGHPDDLTMLMYRRAQ
ncbi:MAG: protein phosphatase 2C domain-containing protein [Pseudomonadales bacterium]